MAQTREVDVRQHILDMHAGEVTDFSKVVLPEKLQGMINLGSWANALVLREKYREPDPEYLSLILLMQTLTAATPDEVLRQAGVGKLQEMIPNVPGANTGPIEINDLYVTESDFGEGAPCYVIMTWRDLELGTEVRATTGAQQVQAQLIKLLAFGIWPIRCCITRLDRKDKGDRYLFWVGPPQEGR